MLTGRLSLMYYFSNVAIHVAKIDEESLILSGKVFQAVITLGTKDEYIY